MTGELKPIMAPQARRQNRNTLYKSKPDIQNKENFEIFELMYSVSKEFRTKFYTLGIELNKANKWKNAFEIYTGSKPDEISSESNRKSSDTQSKDVRSRINTMKSLKINEKSNLNDASSESFSLNNTKPPSRSHPGSIKHPLDTSVSNNQHSS